jgi:hypothetical protein
VSFNSASSDSSNAKRASEGSIRGIAKRHHGRESVETSAKEDEDEPAALLDLREVDDGKAERRDAAEAHVANEGAAIHGHLH